MTAPRYVVPGACYFITSRAVSRSFRFVPKQKVTEILDYCVAVTATKPKFADTILLHEWKFMSNHVHLLLTDLEGIFPEFMEELNSLISRSLNALRGWSGTNFEKGYNVVRVTDAAKCIEHAAYTLANAVAADLVARARHWKGSCSLRMDYGEVRAIQRPKFGLWSGQRTRVRDGRVGTGRRYKRGRSVLPEVVEFALARPPFFAEEFTDREFRAEVLRQVAERERIAEEQRAARGIKVRGFKWVQAQDWRGMPTSRDELFQTSPRFSGKSKWARIEAAQRLVAFLREYQDVLARYRNGDVKVMFPLGTFQMRRRYGVRCAGPPG